MKANFPDGFVKRYPGNTKKTMTRTQLHAPGPYYEIHCDGHDKLAEAGLKLNGVGLPIYGIRDQYSSAILHLVVVPNNRLAATIGYLYLDLLENLKGTYLIQCVSYRFSLNVLHQKDFLSRLLRTRDLRPAICMTFKKHYGMIL